MLLGESAEERFSRLTEARDCLTNTECRETHDATLRPSAQASRRPDSAWSESGGEHAASSSPLAVLPVATSPSRLTLASSHALRVHGPVDLSQAASPTSGAAVSGGGSASVRPRARHALSHALSHATQSRVHDAQLPGRHLNHGAPIPPARHGVPGPRGHRAALRLRAARRALRFLFVTESVCRAESSRTASCQSPGPPSATRVAHAFTHARAHPDRRTGRCGGCTTGFTTGRSGRCASAAATTTAQTKRVCASSRRSGPPLQLSARSERKSSLLFRGPLLNPSACRSR